MELRELKGIGEKTEKLFWKLGITSAEDLLAYYPRTYETFGEPLEIAAVEEGMLCSVVGYLEKSPAVRRIRSLQIVTVQIKDQTGTMNLTWFNMPYLRNALKPGSRFVFRGKVVKKGNKYTMEQPILHTLEHYAAMQNSMRPVYGLTKGLSNNLMISAMEQVLSQAVMKREYFPEWMREEYKLAEANFAIQNIHFPKSEQELYFARRRLVFEEFFFFILAVRRLKEERVEAPNHFSMERKDSALKLLASLPYALTGAQLRVWRELQEDLTGAGLMNRLVQGDVGSGKTILAVLAMAMVTDNGYQAALMAPTEVLARQHAESVRELLKKAGIHKNIELLTGSMTAKEKREAYARIAAGEADMIIGTHAVIQDKVEFKHLALVITDEQHRFGVKQRERLGEKGEKPHTLVMSATPIPRTLAIIIYGDLDISIVDEMPANRLPIKNCVVGTSFRPKAYAFIAKEVAAGHQAYVICPMVEESEMMDAENVLDYTKVLREELPSSVRVEYLHGKLKPKEKNKIMEAFAAGEIQVLVSTTVVEVGVNVPNATVMMVENAERFGLAQLHQLRGRVGRGKWQSYCIFINGSDSRESAKRLDILNKSNDGFFIASEDLKLRGPGDFFGHRQSGSIEFMIGDIFTDANILKDASDAVDKILEEDAELLCEGHEELRKKLDGYLQTSLEKLSL